MSALLSSSYFPNIQYLSKFLIYDNILIEQFDSYSKQSYRNRCEILSANTVQTLTVPVKKNKYTYTKDILIDYSEDWQKNHIRAIMSAYKNSAFYDFFEEEISSIIMSKEKYLTELNTKTLNFLMKVIDINKQYSFTEKYLKPGNFKDYRNTIHPKKRMQKADKYFNPKKYSQVFSDRFDFVPNLSCLDLICNEGQESLKVLKESIC